MKEPKDARPNTEIAVPAAAAVLYAPTIAAKAVTVRMGSVSCLTMCDLAGVGCDGMGGSVGGV